MSRHGSHSEDDTLSARKRSTREIVRRVAVYLKPYKLMALEVVLAPTWAELVFPPFWVAAGAVLLLIFLATGWARAASSRD